MKTDALAGKYTAGRLRTTHRNRQNHLKGTVNQKVIVEAKAFVRTTKNRQNKQKAATINAFTWKHCSVCATFYRFFNFLSINLHFA